MKKGNADSKEQSEGGGGEKGKESKKACWTTNPLILFGIQLQFHRAT